MTTRSTNPAITDWLDRLSPATRERLSLHDLDALADAIWTAVDSEQEEVLLALDRAEGSAADEEAPLPDAPERVRLLGARCDESLRSAERAAQREQQALELLCRILALGNGDQVCVFKAGQCRTHLLPSPCVYGEARALVITGEVAKNGSSSTSKP